MRSPTIEKEASLLEEDSNLLPLSGTSGEALAREIYDHKQSLNFLNLAPAISSRPVLILTANDGLAPADHLLAEALRKSGDAHVAEQQTTAIRTGDQNWQTQFWSGPRQTGSLKRVEGLPIRSSPNLSRVGG